MCICVDVYVYMCVCVYVCMCVCAELGNNYMLEFTNNARVTFGYGLV